MTTRPTLFARTPVKIELPPTPATAPAQRVPAFPSRPPARLVPYDATPKPIPAWRKAAPWAIVFLVCCAWDRAVWLMATRNGTPILKWLKDSIAWENFWPTVKGAAHFNLHALADLAATLAYGTIYYSGQMWLWIGIALFFIFRHWGGTDGAKVRDGLRRGVFVTLVPLLAGAGAEALKFIIRRARPEADNGAYAFVHWPNASPLDPAFWTWDGLGFASSHAAVAVGGALAAGLLLPRWRLPLYLLAALCTLSRIAVGAHFLSDALAGVALAFGSYHLVYAWDRRNNRGMGLPAHVAGASPEGLVTASPAAHVS